MSATSQQHYGTEFGGRQGNQHGWHGAASMYVIEKAVKDAPARNARFKSTLQTIGPFIRALLPKSEVQ